MTILTSPHRLDVHYDRDTHNVNVTFELPDGQKEDVSIDVRNNVLTVSEGDKTSSERGEGRYVNRERRYGKFARSLTLVVFKLLPRACWFIGVANLRRAADLEL
jgi:HSP20 family molecular chaperone IbpA